MSIENSENGQGQPRDPRSLGQNLNEDIQRELQRELDGAMAPDQVVRRNCAFCGRERSPKDDNHADACPYWALFGPHLA